LGGTRVDIACVSCESYVMDAKVSYLVVRSCFVSFPGVYYREPKSVGIFLF
jgi:hypothetical protein